MARITPLRIQKSTPDDGDQKSQSRAAIPSKTGQLTIAGEDMQKYCGETKQQNDLMPI